MRGELDLLGRESQPAHRQCGDRRREASRVALAAARANDGKIWRCSWSHPPGRHASGGREHL